MREGEQWERGYLGSSERVSFQYVDNECSVIG